MVRVRSPNYPAISLPDAIQRVSQVFAKERQHLAPREVIIKGMGYGGVHGASLSAFSAALKYGLIEQEGKDYRVSQRAVMILHPHNQLEKADAIREASLGPNLFSELVQHFKGDIPSDDNLRAYLVRRGFSEAALADVIRSFRETLDLVSKETGGYTPSADMASQSESAQMNQPTPTSVRALQRQMSTIYDRGHEKEPFRVSFTGGGIDVSGRIATLEDAEDFVRAVNALKLLLKPVEQVKRLDDEPEGTLSK